jgi:lysozyme family protein
MAKTMQNVKTKEVKRVTNSEAKQLYQSNNWKYIGKYQGKRIIENGEESK